MGLLRILGQLTRDELAALRQYMLHYALAELRDADEAEEMVQQALVAALEAHASFEGRSTVRTWLIAILKHKIFDHRRREANNPIVNAPHQQDAEGDHKEWMETLDTPPQQSWGDPVKALEQRRLCDAIESGLRKLPAAGARAFWLSELQGVDTQGICAELGISSTNCWVMLHRARLGLRLALRESGFAG